MLNQLIGFIMAGVFLGLSFLIAFPIYNLAKGYAGQIPVVGGYLGAGTTSGGQNSAENYV